MRKELQQKLSELKSSAIPWTDERTVAYNAGEVMGAISGVEYALSLLPHQPLGYAVVPIPEELPNSEKEMFVNSDGEVWTIYHINSLSCDDWDNIRKQYVSMLRPVFTPEAQEAAEIDPTNESMGMNAARHWKKKHDDLLASRNGYTREQMIEIGRHVDEIKFMSGPHTTNHGSHREKHDSLVSICERAAKIQVILSSLTTSNQ